MQPTTRLWPWAVASSVLLAASVGLQSLTARTIVRTDLGVSPDHSRLAIEQLTDMLGGDDAARQIAEDIIERTRIDIERAPVPSPESYDEAR